MNHQLGYRNDVVFLRSSTDADVDLLWTKAYSNQQFMQKFRAQDQVSDREELRLRMIRARQMPFVSNGFREFIIEHRELGPVGMAVLANYCYKIKEAEFLTGVWQESKGLIGAGAAANMLLWEYCFKVLKMKKIYALVYPQNKKPQRILSAMGLTRTVEDTKSGELLRFELTREQFVSNTKLAGLTRKVFGRDFTSMDFKTSQLHRSNDEKREARIEHKKPLFPQIQGKNDLIKNAAFTTALVSMPLASQAIEFNVTEALDDGTGMVTNSLSWAILQANTAAGSDVITLNTDVTFTGVMKRLIDSDVVIQSDGTQRTISGDNSYQPLFVKSGTVEINNLKITNGRSIGGTTSKGGPGAGLGGGLFIYDGDVTLNQVEMNQNGAFGSLQYTSQAGPYGGGGMRGNAAYYSVNGGGLFVGNYGGYGAYQANDARFGMGGNSSNVAGFGGGGYGADSNFLHGGFGGGGGKNLNGVAGDGGFGAGGGGTFQGTPGSPGFGASNSQSAGLGGAIFIRSGALNIISSSFTENSAGGFSGLGGALFVLHTTTNTNGNNQGMPFNLPAVNGCNVSFTNNMASTDAGTEFDNDDYFDGGELIGAGVGFDVLCPGDLIFKNDFETVD